MAHAHPSGALQSRPGASSADALGTRPSPSSWPRYGVSSETSPDEGARRGRGDEPARRIPRRFDPREALATPEHVEKALAGSEPRDIALAVWQRLAIQAARLTPEDLGPLSYWPFNAVQALAFLWVSTARRPNELLRLRADCVRTQWEPDMSDEAGDRVPTSSATSAAPRSPTCIPPLQSTAGLAGSGFRSTPPTPSRAGKPSAGRCDQPSTTRRIVNLLNCRSSTAVRAWASRSSIGA
jgi:hypothetical protein